MLWIKVTQWKPILSVRKRILNYFTATLLKPNSKLWNTSNI